MEKKLRKQIKKVAKKLAKTKDVDKAQELVSRVSYMLDVVTGLKDFKIK